jgi:hypothetical protein
MHADANRSAREEDATTDHPFDAETDPAPAGVEGDLDVEPSPGGYAGRDPKTEMPSVPSVPESQEDPGERGADDD